MEKKVILFLSVLFLFTYCKNDDLEINKKFNSFSQAEDNKDVLQDKLSLDKAQQFQSVLRAIAKKVEPAVVNIRAERKIATTNSEMPMPFFEDLVPEHRKKQSQKAQAIGSGFIFSRQGYVMTNAHVIDKAENITVILQNEKEFQAKVVGVDELSDLAVLSISAGEDIPVVSLGDSNEIQPGNLAIAIGNPFGLSGTFTFGVISATERTEGTMDKNAAFKNFIQTDASINQGNSGGPLLNVYGQVIGINTAIFSADGSGSVGIGFAIPINIAKKVAIQLIERGSVERGYIGILIHDISEQIAKYLKLDKKEGAFVNNVIANSPSEKAGVKAGDLILKVNGQEIKNASSLINTISGYHPNEKVNLTIFRNGKIISLTVIVDHRPNENKIENVYKAVPENQPQNLKSWMGLSVGNIADYRQQFKLRSEKGVVVTNVQSNSPAAEASLKVGDVIESVNYQEVNDLNTFNRIIEAEKAKTSFLLAIKRNGQTKFVVLEKE